MGAVIAHTLHVVVARLVARVAQDVAHRRIAGSCLKCGESRAARRLVSAVLVSLELLLALAALAGAGTMILDPTGALLRMPVELLEQTPFDSWLVPGILLAQKDAQGAFAILLQGAESLAAALGTACKCVGNDDGGTC